MRPRGRCKLAFCHGAFLLLLGTSKKDLACSSVSASGLAPESDLDRNDGNENEGGSMAVRKDLLDVILHRAEMLRRVWVGFQRGGHGLVSRLFSMLIRLTDWLSDVLEHTIGTTRSTKEGEG